MRIISYKIFTRTRYKIPALTLYLTYGKMCLVEINSSLNSSFIKPSDTRKTWTYTVLIMAYFRWYPAAEWLIEN